MTTTLAIGAIALTIAVAAWLVLRARAERALADLRAHHASALARGDEAARRALELQAQLTGRDALVAQLQDELATAQQERVRLQTELDGERRAAAEKLALVDDARLSLKDAFAALSAEALRTNNESFLTLATSTLEKGREAATSDLAARQKEIAGLIEPMRDSLGRITEHLTQVDRERLAASETLTVQLRSVVDTQERLRRETEGLVRALKSPNQRGRWGEIQLRNIIERAGMTHYCGDFIEKDSVEDGDGRRSVPDMTVQLPNGACIVIDAKVPIDAYLRAVEAPDDQRDGYLREHARQVREHIKALAAKTYWARFTPAPELVVMFLPGEPLFSTALQFDQTLFDFSADHRVIPASPLTLLALLRTVASAWQHQRLTDNAEQIRALGKELYERLATMADYVQDVGLNLKQAAAAYDRFLGSLDSRVLASARRFRDLGITPAKELPETPLLHLDVRESRAQELRLPVQELLIDAEIITDEPAPATAPAIPSEAAPQTVEAPPR